MDTGSGVLVLPTSEPGHFLFGPYLPLQAGSYSLAIKFRAAWVLRPKEPVLTIEIAAGEKVLLSEILSADVSELARLASETAQLASGFRHGRAVTTGIVVALVGAVNTGKSSLLNALVGRERAIVAESACSPTIACTGSPGAT